MSSDVSSSKFSLALVRWHLFRLKVPSWEVQSSTLYIIWPDFQSLPEFFLEGGGLFFLNGRFLLLIAEFVVSSNDYIFGMFCLSVQAFVSLTTHSPWL